MDNTLDDIPVDRKDVFLQSLRSDGKTKYARYNYSPLKYVGGKSLAVGTIVEKIPSDTKKVMSPFMGGGNVEVAIARELGIPVQSYDIFDMLVNYWKCQIHFPAGISEHLMKYKPTVECYFEIKKTIEENWDWEKGAMKKAPGDFLEAIKWASLYYYNHNTSYGPYFLGHPSSVALRDNTYYSMVEKVKRFDVQKNLKVDCKDFRTAIQEHPDDFIYADPPYYIDKDTVKAGYYPTKGKSIFHNEFDHEALRDLLLNHKSGFILSYNDCPVIREWYKDCEMEFPEWKYSLGRSNAKDHKESTEILIWRY